MLLPSFAIVVGLIALVWSSDRFVDGAAAIAENIGISKLMVGLTIVSLGTSAPEILVSGIAAYTGSPALAIGNAIGSNIANIGMVLGITATIVVVPIHKISLSEDLPAYLAIMVLCTILLLDNELGSVDGLILLSALFVIVFLLVKLRAKVSDPTVLEEYESEEHNMEMSRSIFWFVIGLVILLLSSRLLVWGAVEFARLWEVSEVIIGLTIVAIGTSLPELAATLSSALKNHHDMAFGNIIGSNILNLLAVLCLPALISPGELEPGVLFRDYSTMVVLSLMLAAFIYMPFQHAVIGRAKGVVLFLSYISYISFLAYTAS